LWRFTGSVRGVNPILETWHIVVRELRKNFRSVKGIVLLTLSVLGGGGLALIHVFLEQGQKKLSEGIGTELSQGKLEEANEMLFQKWYGNPEIAKYLAPSTSALPLATLITYAFIPLLIAIIGFDGISGEVQHRSVRFWTARSRKTSYYLGKVLGLWLTVSLMLLIMHSIVWIVLIVGGADTASKVAFWGLRYVVTTIPVAGAWTGIAVLLASQFRTPLVSLLTVCALFFIMFLADKVGSAVTMMKNASGRTDAVNWLDYAYPSAYDGFLLHPSPAKWGLGLGLSMAFLVLTSLAGMAIFQKRDV
jgi:ABC-type transport system involved in multi-copper enzyme maturation permease subunit